jgi:hypothetical protein
MANLILNGSTSGSVTLSSPAVSGTTTLTLPTTSGTVLTNGTNTNFPAGSVLQVVNATYSTQTSSATTSYVDTGLTASITPSSSSNKILVIVHQSGVMKQTNNTYVGLRLLRNSTTIVQFENQAGFSNNTNTNTIGGCGTNYLDSPATTSSVTYKTQLASAGAAASALTNAGGETSTITLMEIKG